MSVKKTPLIRPLIKTDVEQSAKLLAESTNHYLLKQGVINQLYKEKSLNFESG